MSPDDPPITPCPGCGVQSGENYGGKGMCWPCYSTEVEAAEALPRATAYTPKAVDWLWKPFIPRGKITAVAGQMGQAKSLLTAWEAAAVTNGVHGSPGSVVMLSAEDDPEDTIVPRLLAVGADLHRVALPRDQELDVERIEGYCAEIGDVRLITIDPLAAFLPSRVDSWKSQHVRRALEPLRRLAQGRGVAVLLVQHLNRGDSSDAVARIADSQGIPALARSVLIWGASPSDPDGDQGVCKVLTVAKGNLARGTHSAEFRIEEVDIGDGIRAPRLVYTGESDVRAEDVTADQEARTQTDDATMFLRDFLAEGAKEANDVKEAAREAGVSDKCLRTARERIARFYRPGGNEGPYVWELRLSSGTIGHSRDTRANTNLTPTNPIGHSRHSGAFTGIHDPVDALVAQDAQLAHFDVDAEFDRARTKLSTGPKL